MLIRKGLLHQERDYAKLFGAGIVNGIGDRFSQVAVLGLLLSLTGSGLAVGIAFAIRLLPYLIFAPIGGWLADRFPRKQLMVATDLIRAAFALLPLLVQDAGDIWIIWLSMFLLSSGEALYVPARMSAIPLLVRKEHLLKINSLEEVMTGLILIFGSVTGGAVAVWLGSEASFLCNAVSFVISALLLARLPQLSRAAQHDEHAQPQSASPGFLDHAQSEPPARRQGWAEFKSLLAASPYLRLMLFIFAVWPIGDGIFNILLSIYATEVFHAGDFGIGLMYGALGIGLVAGSALTGRFARQLRIVAILSLLAEGICHIFVSQSGSMLVAAGLMVLTAAISSIGGACNQTILMNTVPEYLRGRFMGLLGSMQNTIMGTSMFVSGFLLEVLTPRMLGLAGGLFLMTMGACFTAVYLIFRPRLQA